jgi:hypothetical protein
MDDIEIIPSELILSGSARRLRSVDAKLQEEMKSISGSQDDPLLSSSSSSSSQATLRQKQTKPVTPAIMPRPIQEPKYLSFPTLLSSRESRPLGRPHIPLRPTFVAKSDNTNNSNVKKKKKKKTDLLLANQAKPRLPVPLPPRRSDGRFMKTEKPARARPPPAPTSATPKKITSSSPFPRAKKAVSAGPLPPPKVNLSPGEWVWGKKFVEDVETWLPAEIVDPESSDAPLSVLQDAKEKLREGKVLLWFIERGGKRSWAWVLGKHLLGFGHRRSAVRRMKKLDQYIKDLVMDAYQEALKFAVPKEETEGYDDDDDDDDDM